MGLRPRFKTPVSQARDKLLAYAIRPLKVFQPRTRFFIGCGVLVLLTTLLLLSNRPSNFNENYKLGDVLGRSIVAPTDLTAMDQAETERRKADARESTRPVFNYDSSRAETSVQSFRSAWEELQKQTSRPEQISRLEWRGRSGGSASNHLAQFQRDRSRPSHFHHSRDRRRLHLRRRRGESPATGDRTRRRSQSRGPIDFSSAEDEDDSAFGSAQKSGVANRQSSGLVTRTKDCADCCTVAPDSSQRSPGPNGNRRSPRDRSEPDQPVVISLKRNQVVAREGDTVTPNILAQITQSRTRVTPVGHGITSSDCSSSSSESIGRPGSLRNTGAVAARSV